MPLSASRRDYVGLWNVLFIVLSFSDVLNIFYSSVINSMVIGNVSLEIATWNDWEYKVTLLAYSSWCTLCKYVSKFKIVEKLSIKITSYLWVTLRCLGVILLFNWSWYEPVATHGHDPSDDPKKKRRKKRSSNNLMRNGFPNRSVRQRKQEGVEDALVEYSPSIEVGSMAGLMI
jgi:hypothetical protein